MKWFSSLAICLTFILSLHSQAQVISEAVASVKKDAVTSRQIKIDWIVETLLYNKSKSTSIPMLNSDIKSKEFEQELNRFLMETVVYLESKLFKIVESKEDEVNLNISKFKNKLGDYPSLSEEWRKLAPTSAELKAVFERKLQAKSFIEFKAKASLIPPTEAEIFNYYKNNRKKFGTKPYKDFKDSIKNYLSKTQADQRLSEWFGVLKKKYQVRKVYFK